MNIESCHSVFHLIQYPSPSASAPRLAVSQKMFNRKPISRKKLLSAIVVKVAAPPFQSRWAIKQETILQSSARELERAVFYSDQTTELETANDDHAPLAGMWKEIQGSHQWNGLLDPMHPLLLSEIIRYGVFVRTTYEAFDWEPGSKYNGSCKYGRQSLLGQLGMGNCGYQISKYIYAATPDIDVPDFLKNKLDGRDGSNWIGYVAVTEDETEIKRLGRRDIVVALRGTATCMEWLANFMHTLTPARLNPLDPREDVKVEMGFLSLYTSHDHSCRFNNGSAREQLLCEIARLVQKYKGEELSITITGHSMGSALAMLCAYDIAELELNRPNYESCSRIPITLYSFGGPRVGNVAFKDRCDELGLRILRVVNVHDVVTKIPGVIFNENFRIWENVLNRYPWTYSHVGVELALDHKLQRQFFIGDAHNPSRIHDLATYLQLLAACCNHHRDRLRQHNHDNKLHHEGNSDSAPNSLIRHICSVFEKHKIVFDPASSFLSSLENRFAGECKICGGNEKNIEKQIKKYASEYCSMVPWCSCNHSSIIGSYWDFL